MITPVNGISYKPTFQSNCRRVSEGSRRYANSTTFFRSDMNWDAFIWVLKTKYSNAAKVNFLDFACSDGSEPWSLAILLMDRLGESANRFFPIKASDIDDEMIRRATVGSCNISYYDEDVLKFLTGNHFDNYFNVNSPTEQGYKGSVCPKSSLQERVKFKQLDIFEGLRDLQPQNNVIMCRNFWGYLQGDDARRLADILAEKLDETSLVVIGAFDKELNYDKLLTQRGFTETAVTNVYSK